MTFDHDESDDSRGGVATVIAPDEPGPPPVPLPAEPLPDAELAARIAAPGLRRLVRNAAGLSTESIDLLAAITDRLRAAEGALADPATNDSVR